MILPVLAIALLAQAPAGAPLAPGGIRAEIRDAGGAPVPGVEIRLRHRDGRRWTTTTDGRGRFQVGGLPPGDLELACRKAGFAAVHRRLRIPAGSWLLGAGPEPAGRTPGPGKAMRLTAPPPEEAPALAPRPGLEKIPMH